MGVDSIGEGEGEKALDCEEIPYGIDFLQMNDKEMVVVMMGDGK